MNSWNRTTSYANNVKLHNLNIPKELMNTAYKMLEVDEVDDEIRRAMREWAADRDYVWQVGFNGRSNGYLVLYQGGSKRSEYKSCCANCGQRNFKAVMPKNPTPEWLKANKDWYTKDSKCGVCGANARVNYIKPPLEVFSYSGKSVDMHEDFEEWDDSSLRSRVELIQEFDKLCDKLADMFINMCKNYTVEKEVIMVPKTVMVLRACETEVVE